jgi:hypothetical protein
MEILGITEQWARVKELIERVDIPDKRKKGREVLEKMGIDEERIKSIQEDLGIPETKDRIEDIMDVAGLGDDYRELLGLFEVKEEEEPQ